MTLRELMQARHNGLISDTRPKIDEVAILNELSGDLKGYDCTKCRNKGVIYFKDGETDEIFYRKCECSEKRKTLYRIQQAGIKHLFDKYTFENFKAEDNYQLAMKNLAINYTKCEDIQHRFFFIGGQSGAGKTHICTAIVGKMILLGKPSRYMMWRDETAKLKSIANTPDYSKQIEEFKRTEVLYIDDLFKTQDNKLPTAGDIHIAFEIINYRYNNYMYTVISSELTLPEIIEIDEATGGRINEMGGKNIINLKKDRNKNYRLHV